MQQSEKFQEHVPNLANSSDCIEISNYISRQSTQREPLIFQDDENVIDANNKSMGEVVGSQVDKFEFRLGTMKAKLDQIRTNIGGGKKEESEEDHKYYEISTHRGNQELEADQVTIEENPVDIVNRKKMEMRAWQVKDMPRASIEVEKLFAAAAIKLNNHNNDSVVENGDDHEHRVDQKDESNNDDDVVEVQRQV